MLLLGGDEPVVEPNKNNNKKNGPNGGETNLLWSQGRSSASRRKQCRSFWKPCQQNVKHLLGSKLFVFESVLVFVFVVFRNPPARQPGSPF